MKFWKMHGAGNDFIIINNIEERIPAEELPALVKRLCAFHTSVGADGAMIVTKPKKGGDVAMLFFNSDGSVGEMCGNGARCICRWAYENGYVGEIQRVETTAGLVTGRRISERLYEVRLNDPSVLKPYWKITVNGKEYDCGYVELGCPGIPHAVVELPDWSGMDRKELFALGKMIRRYKDFPKGANVTFTKITGENCINAVTFERGVEDFTLACGTGAGSTAAILTLRGEVTGKNVKIKMPGGELFVSLDRSGQNISNIYLTGPATLVFVGEMIDA